MRKTWTLGATGAALATMFTVGGCYDFDEAEQRCRDELRCDPGGVGPPDGGGDDGGTDGGTDGGEDAGCTPNLDIVDLPDDFSADTDCDGVDGQADAGLFVDPAAGNDSTGTGTREAPLATLGRAIALLRAADGGGPTRVYLAGGPYNETGLDLNVPASLHGGYVGRGGGWQRPRTELARLNGGAVGLTVRDLTDAGIVLEYVNVRSANGTAPSEPSIALRVLRSSGVELRHAVLEAGLGAPGADGGSGERGQNGPDGGNGGAAAGRDPGTIAEITPTSCSGSDRSGGAGGPGVVNSAGSPGSPGQPDAGGGDGGAGNNSPTTDPDTGNRICNGRIGGPGSPGTFGDEGVPGSKGGGTGTLDLMSGAWRTNQQGGGGDAGTPGEGGGGGGSGGTCTAALSFTSAASGAGGGGGGGGCGGTGGLGGGGGGASIALLLVDSQVEAGEGTQLRTLGGGPGGSGGGGGEGGKGGEGGDGGAGGFVQGIAGGLTYQTNGGRGGVGGRGGNGGNGGAGGGGGGGPSVGVWCGGEDAGVTLADGGTITFTLGDGGVGGASPANRGDDGVKEDLIGCQPIQ